MDLLRRLLPYTSVIVVLALGYAGWTLLSRKRANRLHAEAAEVKKAEADRKVVKAYGEGHLKILSFYASPPALKSGEKGLLCYGVVNAESIRIEPAVEAIAPSLSRCIAVSPKANTEYTLRARDAAGESASQSVTIAVR